MNKSQLNAIISCLNKAQIGDTLIIAEKDARTHQQVGEHETIIWGKSKELHGSGLADHQKIYHFILSASWSLGMPNAELGSSGYKRYYDIDFDLMRKSNLTRYHQLYDLTHIYPVKIIKQAR